MQSSTVAGYKDLFPNGTKTYEDLVTGIPSEGIIRLFITINRELDSKEEKFALQRRLYKEVIKRLPRNTKTELNNAFYRFYLKTNKTYQGLIFGRRYLLELIAHELSNYREIATFVSTLSTEYNLFKAYLLIVDKVNARDHTFVNFKKLDLQDNLSKYRILWPVTINQFEWNERPSPMFETFKVCCLLMHAKTRYPSYLKTYLQSIGFQNAGQLLASFAQVNKAATVDTDNGHFRKLVYIAPTKGASDAHLLGQSINQLIGPNKTVTIAQLKKFPLFKTADRGYMVFDDGLYLKKNFMGPFFELYYSTGLDKVEKFNAYSQFFSDELERVCFVPIIKLLCEHSQGHLHFDDATKGVPDAYLRVENIIFLFEYKAYLFKDELAINPDFDSIKKYIDEKFVGAGKKPKGVGQLRSQIEVLNNGGFPFDPISPEQVKHLVVYPILVHHGFHFNIPGINDYLNNQFFEQIGQININFDIKPVVMANLGSIMDIMVCGKDILYLRELIDEYQAMISAVQLQSQGQNIPDVFLNAHISFDEVYSTIYSSRVINAQTSSLMEKLRKMAGINITELNKTL